LSEQEPPKIEFPCDYPIKVMGRSSEDFERVVFATVEAHAPGFDRERVQQKDSRKGNFLSLTIIITATGQRQLETLHQDLMDTGLVKMVI
jgi:putative lipoic acid-binding regulatory protein